MNSRNLEGKVVVVTGGSRGIGRQIVLGAIERGAQVAFCTRKIGRDALVVKEEAERCGKPGQVIAVRADVSEEGDVEALFDATLHTFGKVDVVVNNAGIVRANVLVTLATQDWDEIIATNLTGAFLTSRRAIKAFLASGEDGRIVTVGSIAQDGMQSHAGYAASKGGLVGLTHAIAQEYGSNGIYAYLVVVGYVDTRLTGHVPDSLKRAAIESSSQWREASADEIASVVLFLASDRALCRNGQTFHASAGSRGIPPY
jgi:3-oxoacyl-[acyl-carrier protein] reductase